jgi:hypothetical protein
LEDSTDLSKMHLTRGDETRSEKMRSGYQVRIPSGKNKNDTSVGQFVPDGQDMGKVNIIGGKEHRGEHVTQRPQ